MCVTAIDGVGFTIPVGVVVDATEDEGLIEDMHVVCVVLEIVSMIGGFEMMGRGGKG